MFPLSQIGLLRPLSRLVIGSDQHISPHYRCPIRSRHCTLDAAQRGSQKESSPLQASSGSWLEPDRSRPERKKAPVDVTQVPRVRSSPLFPVGCPYLEHILHILHTLHTRKGRRYTQRVTTSAGRR
ncbi:hypothetical protein BDV11DRAFT_184838 [Aspergillus similis]